MEPSNPYQPPKPSVPVPGAGGAVLQVQPGSNFDFNRAMRFFFEDPRWLNKLLLGGLFYVLAIFLIGGFFIAGYMMELIRRSAAGEPYPLPEWENLGDMFVEGAQVLVVYLAFIVPLIVMYLVPLVAMALLSESGEPPAAMGFVVVLFMLFVALMYVALLLYFPAAVIRMAIERRISAAFEFSDNFEFIKRNIVNFLLAILIYMLASFVAQFGMILFCVGIFPAAFWGVCVGAYSFGEVVLRDPGRSPSPSALT